MVEPAENGAVATGPNGERCTLALGRGVRVEPRAEGGVVARVHLRQGERRTEDVPFLRNVAQERVCSGTVTYLVDDDDRADWTLRLYR